MASHSASGVHFSSENSEQRVWAKILGAAGRSAIAVDGHFAEVSKTGFCEIVRAPIVSQTPADCPSLSWSHFAGTYGIWWLCCRAPRRTAFALDRRSAAVGDLSQKRSK